MPDASDYDLEFRPESYFDIKHNESKCALFPEALTEPERQFMRSVPPKLMGREYLPDLGDQEVEIAKVVLGSTTGDVFSIWAEAKDDLLRYRIVSEYLEGDEIPPVSELKNMLMSPTVGYVLRLI